MIDGRYSADESTQWSIALVGDEAWTNYVLEVDVVTNNWNWPVRIIVRAQGGSYMALETNCSDTSWILVSEGKENKIATSKDGGLTGRIDWHTNRIRIEVVDSIYTAYSDNRLLVRVQDNTLTHGRVGLAMKRKGSFDNLLVSQLP